MAIGGADFGVAEVGIIVVVGFPTADFPKSWANVCTCPMLVEVEVKVLGFLVPLLYLDPVEFGMQRVCAGGAVSDVRVVFGHPEIHHQAHALIQAAEHILVMDFTHNLVVQNPPDVARSPLNGIHMPLIQIDAARIDVFGHFYLTLAVAVEQVSVEWTL